MARISTPLTRLAGRAAPLPERLRGAAGAGEAGEEARKLRDLWCHEVFTGDAQCFRARLELLGTDPESVLAHLGDIDSALTDAPPWLSTLAECRAALADPSVAPPTGQDLLDAARPLPFAESLLPLVLTARRRLAARVGERPAGFAPAALDGLARGLLGRLAGTSGLVLGRELSAFRAAKSSGLGLLLTRFAEPSGRDLYRRFCERLAAGGLGQIWEEHPVLARLTATLIDDWVDASAELIERFQADRPALLAAFGGSAESGEVIHLLTGLSDPHVRGRTVAVLTLASGLRLVYKPRDLDLEAAFHHLLAWIGERPGLPPLRPLCVLPRHGYGWTEFVAHRPCRTEPERERFYLRAGMLVALLHLLNGTDCHCENLIAAGEHPVLIDAETLCAGQPPEPAAGGSPVAAVLAQVDRQGLASVLRTGLLPRWELGPDGVCYDVSALGAVAPQRVAAAVLDFVDVNTDRMALGLRPVERVPLTNVPFPGADPGGYVDSIVAGFSGLYRWLAAHRRELLAVDGLLSRFAGTRFRLVVRPTQAYLSLLRLGAEPAALRDGSRRSILLDRLARSLALEQAGAEMWQLLAGEHAALERLDVPRFTGWTDRLEVEGPEGTHVESFFATSGIEVVRRRAVALCAADLERQAGLIRGAFATCVETPIHGPAAPGDPPGDPPAAGDELPAEVAADAGGAVAEIFARLAAGAATAAGDRPVWITLRYVEEARRYQLYPLGRALYDGEAGAALFLAAYWRVSGEPDARRLAHATLASLEAAVRSPGDDPELSRCGLGAGFGWGSIAYAFVRASGLLGEETWLTPARAAAARITGEQIDGSPELDLLLGVAGAIPGLLALYRATGEPAALDRARACGARLVAAQQPQAAGGAAWAGASEGRATSGFAHGASGIAHALLLLYRETGEAALLRAAHAAFDFERALFLPDERNWAYAFPLAEPAAAGLRASWCHGAPGIALARLSALEGGLDTPEIRRDLDEALETTARSLTGPVDHLCCGDLGRAEILFEAGRRLGRPELTALARHTAAQVTARARRGPGFRLLAGRPDLPPSPVFFQGLAGIGYHLLRTGEPASLPSVLQFG